MTLHLPDDAVGEPPDFNISRRLVMSSVKTPLRVSFSGLANSSFYITFSYLFLFFFSLQPTSPKFGKADSYEKLEKLGEGSYATVYKGKSK